MVRGARGGADRSRGRGGATNPRGGSTPTSALRSSITTQDIISTHISGPGQPGRQDNVTESSSAAPMPPSQPLPRTTSAAQTSGRSSVNRFRPKNVRRDEAGRGILAQQELEKQNEHAAADIRARGRGRGRGRGARSRGGLPGRGGLVNRFIATASGPFSQAATINGPARSTSRSGFYAGPSSSGAGGSSSSLKSSSDTKSQVRSFAIQDNHEAGGIRINADKLAMDPLMDREPDDEEQMILELKRKQPKLVLPMAIPRKERKNIRGLVPTATPTPPDEESHDKDQSLFVGGSSGGQSPIRLGSDDKIWKAAAKRYTQVKTEPGTEPAQIVLDFDAYLKKPNREQKQEVDAAETPISRSEEEILETSDFWRLRFQFDPRAIEDFPDVDVPASDRWTAIDEDQIHLFQFPPEMPPLRPAAKPGDEVAIKEEPDDVAMLDTQEQGTASNRTAVGEDSGAKDPEARQAKRAPQGGFIGRLNVRKSGKVELNWGGRILDLTPGAAKSCIATAVITGETDKKAKSGAICGDAAVIGMISGRYVLVPRWDEEEDWDIVPEEMEIR